MKRDSILLLNLLFILLGLGGSSVMAQTPFEGTLRYNIAYTGKIARDILENKPPLKMDMHIKDNNLHHSTI